LLLLTVAVAMVCWYRDLPRQNAERFVAAFNAGNWSRVNALLDHQMIPDGRGDYDQYKASRVQQSVSDWLHGQCLVESYYKAPGRDSYITFMSTARKLQVRSIVSDASSGSMPAR
jgi:hypothetical protein